jgi:hypothetical protein
MGTARGSGSITRGIPNRLEEPTRSVGRTEIENVQALKGTGHRTAIKTHGDDIYL